METQFGCPVFETSQFWVFVNEYRVFMGVDILIFGLVVTFFGRKLIRIVVFMAGLIFGMMGCLTLYFILWYDPAD